MERLKNLDWWDWTVLGVGLMSDSFSSVLLDSSDWGEVFQPQKVAAMLVSAGIVIVVWGAARGLRK